MASKEIPTRLLLALGQGNEEAREKLFLLVYDTLREMAHGQLGRLRPGQTLDTTALVHEAYLKLFDQTALTVHDQTHFFALSATVMRHIVIDYARKRQAQKRGGPVEPVSLHSGQEPAFQFEDRVTKILDLDAALTHMATFNARLSQVVELRFFGGLSVVETALVLGVSPRTVKKDWRKARAFLHRFLGQSPLAQREYLSVDPPLHVQKNQNNHGASYPGTLGTSRSDPR